MEAIKIGFQLVGPRLAELIEETRAVCDDVIVHCWRGGMRSSNFCQFISMAKVKAHQVEGGYKAYRQMAAQRFTEPLKLFSLCGYTGSGKSEVLRALAAHGEQVIDLEQLAHHKGSVFGGLMQARQPTTEQFQNNLFEILLCLDPGRPVWIEDESIAIGEIFLPEGMWKQMATCWMIEIELTKEARIQRLVHEYGSANRTEFLQSMTRIAKKLGGQHFNVAKEKLLADDMSSVIDILLTYYDKAYRNGLESKKKRIKFYSPWNGTDVHVFARQLIKEVYAVHTFA
jgi:tRNA 2-selenouridine synthase